jgi:hypothetical protein
MNKKEMTAALRQIIDSEGVNIIADKPRFKALLGDFLPEYKYRAEQRALLTALEADDWKILIEVHSKGKAEHERAMKILLRQLQEDFGWTAERCVLILECYTAAMGWNDVDVGSIAGLGVQTAPVQPVPQPPPAQKPTPQPTPKPIPPQPVPPPIETRTIPRTILEKVDLVLYFVVLALAIFFAIEMTYKGYFPPIAPLISGFVFVIMHFLFNYRHWIRKSKQKYGKIRGFTAVRIVFDVLLIFFLFSGVLTFFNA